MDKLTEIIYEVRNVLAEDVYTELDDKHGVYRSRAYSLGVYDHTDDILMDYLRKLMDDPKAKAKMVSAIGRNIVAAGKKQERAEKDEYNRNLKLWKASEGRIPCLNKCGHVRVKTKDEVLSGNNNFLCGKCCEGKDSDWSWGIFESTNVFKLFGIEGAKA